MAEELHVFGAAQAERLRVQSLVESLQEVFVRLRSLSAIVPVVYQSAVMFLLVGGLALLYAIGTQRLAALGAVVLLLVRASSYGQQLQTAYQGLGEALPYLDRVTDAIDLHRAATQRPGKTPLQSVSAIDFASVSYAYKPQVPVLRDVSFSLRAGEAIGVGRPLRRRQVDPRTYTPPPARALVWSIPGEWCPCKRD